MLAKTRRLIRIIIVVIKKFWSEYRQTNSAIRSIIKYLFGKLVNLIVLRYNILQVRNRMTQVRDYKEWENYARLLDHLEENNEWKFRLESKSYDYSRLEKRRQMMKQLRKSDNIKTLTHCLRQDLVKNIGNMSNP